MYVHMYVCNMNMYKGAVNIHVQYLIYIAVGGQHCSASHGVAIATVITHSRYIPSCLAIPVIRVSAVKASLNTSKDKSTNWRNNIFNG